MKKANPLVIYCTVWSVSPAVSSWSHGVMHSYMYEAMTGRRDESLHKGHLLSHAQTCRAAHMPEPSLVLIMVSEGISNKFALTRQSHMKQCKAGTCHYVFFEHLEPVLQKQGLENTFANGGTSVGRWQTKAHEKACKNGKLHLWLWQQFRSKSFYILSYTKTKTQNQSVIK